MSKNYTSECPAEEDIIYNEKRRKINDSPDKVYDEIIKPIGNNVLDILNTPLVEKTVSSPFVSNISSILKVIIRKTYLKYRLIVNT